MEENMYCQNRISYRVQEGDSLYKLAKQFHTTVTELILLNSGVNPYNLQTGMRLTICPGEGYVDENDRIIIHKRQCPVAAKLKSSYGNRILATEWDTHKELSFLVYIYIKGIDSMGLLNEVTQVISRQLNVNIRKLTIETEDGIFEGKIQLWVHDVEDVKTICNNLKKIQNIKQVSRVEE